MALPLVCSFWPGLPAHGYGHVLFALPLVLFFHRPDHRRRLGLYVLGIVLQVLAYPEPDLGFLGWVLLWPYLLARRCDDGASWWRAAFVYGFLRAYVGFYWLGNVHFLGWIAVSLGAALAFAFVFELALRRLTVLPYALRVATAWLLFEWVHSWILRGFPWLFLAHTQYRYLPVIQIADLVGALGVSFVMAYVQAAVLEIALRRRVGLAAAFAAASLAALLAYGWLRSGPDGPPGPGVLMIQSSIPHDVKEHGKITAEEMWRSHVQQTRMGIEKHPRTKLIIWPETMNPYGYVEGSESRSAGFRLTARQVARRFQRPVIYGINSFTGWDRVNRGHNSAILVDRTGAVRGLYRKQVLVPMGEEFVPRWFLSEEVSDRWFKWLSSNLGLPRSCDLESGDGFVTLDAGPGLGCAPLICFEGLYADLARGAVRTGEVDLLLHLVNNGWFGRSWEQRQCVASWVMRAVETRTPFFSCANCGITCAVAPSGEILGRVDRVMEKGVLYAEVPPRWPAPFYLRGGVWALPVALLAGFGAAWALARRRSRGPADASGQTRDPG
ncbi:MAG: apolipoprotein N-acyltransferase [Planctomycetota bacterium]